MVVIGLLVVIAVLFIIGVFACIFCYLYGVARGLYNVVNTPERWEKFKAQVEKAFADAGRIPGDLSGDLSPTKE